MPSGSFRISGTPMVTFSKQRGRLEPILVQDDHIKVSLLPSEEVDPGQIAVTFLPSDERVVAQVGQPGNTNFQMDPGNSSASKNSVEISRLGIKVDKFHYSWTLRNSWLQAWPLYFRISCQVRKSSWHTSYGVYWDSRQGQCFWHQLAHTEN